MVFWFCLSYLVFLLIVLVQLTTFSIVWTTSKHCFPIQILAICKFSQGTQGRYFPHNDHVNVCAWVIPLFLDKEGSQLADFAIQTKSDFAMVHWSLWWWLNNIGPHSTKYIPSLSNNTSPGTLLLFLSHKWCPPWKCHVGHIHCSKSLNISMDTNGLHYSCL